MMVLGVLQQCEANKLSMQEPCPRTAARRAGLASSASCAAQQPFAGNTRGPASAASAANTYVGDSSPYLKCNLNFISKTIFHNTMYSSMAEALRVPQTCAGGHWALVASQPLLV